MDGQLRIAYCEDEKIQLEKMEQRLKQWATQNQVQYSFEKYVSGEAFFFENEKQYPFDLLFIDIEMGIMNGMEIARKVRETDENIEIVFLTNRREFVFEGYEVNALRYCVKPIDEEKLNEILRKVISKKREEKCYLIEKQDGEMQKIDLSTVFYIEASGHYIGISTRQEYYQFKKSLQEIMEYLIEQKGSLEQAGFMLSHRSYLVNMKFVDSLNKTECILENGRRIPISRNSYQKVNLAFIHYYQKK